MKPTTAPTNRTEHMRLKALRAWLQEEQRAAQHNLTQCRAACDAEDALYWARRHAQLAITANAVDWFTEAAAL